MSILFRDYELLAKSGLFDADYYMRCNPDIAAHNLDPLMHYLEWGCRERRNPNANFDTGYYLTQCQERGEKPVNALLHFITVGSALGIKPQPKASGAPTARAAPAAPTAADGSAIPGEARDAALLFMIDVPKTDGAAEVAVHGGLSIAGWALAKQGIAGVEVAIDGQRVAVAYCGIRRPDVAAAYPDREGSLQSGYAAHVPPKVLKEGRHRVTITARDRTGASLAREFAIDVKGAAEDHGPAALRLKMSQAEVNLKLSVLKRLEWRPLFRIFITLPAGDTGQAKARRSIESLTRQAYSSWQLRVQSLDAAGHPLNTGSAPTPPEFVLAALGEYADRVQVLAAQPPSRPGTRRKRASAPEPLSLAPTFDWFIAPGDEFGCDALLEFALASALRRDADVIYCDARRLNPADGKVHAFFKPHWSPDLLLSSNYLGRAWCADARLVERAGVVLADLGSHREYDWILRLTEAAKAVVHAPRLLFEQGESPLPAETEPKELEALTAALARRGVAAQVERGLVPGHYRVRRTLKKPHSVSIVIPTCAAGGLVKTCLESLRALTRHRPFEVVCIENIPKERRQWKRWLKKNADVVVETDQPFNWSRFNNRAAAAATGKFLLFLNDDIEIIDPHWLEALLEHAQRAEVGLVGPQLLYPDRTVQHAGVTLDAKGRGRHAFRHQPHDEPGYFGLALTQRNVMSVTGACLMTRREVFERLGKFEEAHSIVNGDLDYCLKSFSAGLVNVYTPYARLVHHELASRGTLGDDFDAEVFKSQWREVIAQGDPYFSQRLSIENDQIDIDREPVEEIYAGRPLFAREAVRRILVVKLDHIGDCITALPAIQRLKRLFPAARLTVLAGRATQSIWASEPAVDEVLEFNLFHARSGLGLVETSREALAQLGETLRARRFDLGVDLRKQPDTRHILRESGAKMLAGFDHQGRFPWLDVALEWDEDVPLRTKRAHVSTDLNALIEAIAASSEPAGSGVAPPPGALKVPGLNLAQLLAKPLVCVHPAAGSEMRQWPLEKFAELIDLFIARGDLNVALIGGADEQDLAARLLKAVAAPRKVFNLVGKIPLADLPNLLGRAALFVGNNSGPQHLAAHLSIPTVGIHSGVVDAREWGPSGVNGVAVRKHMSCSPCFIEHPKDCSRKLACLTGLETAAVFDTCARLLALGAAPQLKRQDARA